MNKITHNTVNGKLRETDFSKYADRTNVVMLADSYKYSHASQYPEMNSMFDYLSSRGGIYPKTVFVGGQIITKGFDVIRKVFEKKDEEIFNITKILQEHTERLERLEKKDKVYI